MMVGPTFSSPVKMDLCSTAIMVMGPSLTLRSRLDRKSTRLNSSHGSMSYAVFCLKKKDSRAIDMTGPPQNGGGVPCLMKVALTSHVTHSLRATIASPDRIIGCALALTGTSKAVQT